MERTRAALWGIAATIILGAMIMAGSRNLAHFDAALVGYTFALSRGINSQKLVAAKPVGVQNDDASGQLIVSQSQSVFHN